MYSEETKSSKLAKFFMIYDYVFLDTCSLMEDTFPAFMDTLEASREYWKPEFEVIVLGECVEELHKHAKSKDNQEARIEAKRALKILRHDRWHHRILTITKSTSNDGFADNALYTRVSSLRIQNKVLIITQDKTLASDLRQMNKLDSQRGRFLMVYRLNQNGDLEENPGEANYGSSTRNYANSSRIQNTTPHHFSNVFFHKEKPQTTPEAVKPAPLAEDPIAVFDRKLCANLNNPNYPSDRKIADIDAQLATLSALSADARSKFSLAFTREQLIEERGKLTAKGTAPEVKDGAILHQENPLPPRPIPAVKEAMKKDEAKMIQTETRAVTAKPIVKKAWYEFGSSIPEALVKAGAHSGIIFRDPSIAYFPSIHGPYDLTSQDLALLAGQVGVLKTGETRDLPLGGLIAHIEKTEKDWKASIEVGQKPEPVAVSKTVEAPVAPTPAPEEKKPVPVVTPSVSSSISEAKPLKTEKKKSRKTPEKKTAMKPTEKKTRKKAETKQDVAPIAPSAATPSASHVTAQDINTAVPMGVTLVVGVPTNEGKKGFIERKIRREENPTVETVKNPNDRSARNKKPSGVKKPAKSAPAKPAVASVVPGDPAVVKEDQSLNAKINNPNYPVKNKIADLEAQKLRLKNYSPLEEKKLFFSKAKIDEKIAELKKA